MDVSVFYSHVNYSVTKIMLHMSKTKVAFYSHVNYSVTKIFKALPQSRINFYSHVNYSVTKISFHISSLSLTFTVT